ncbi:MAG: hypothetical protein R2778_15885 [Saprospiraceae bacterium]
MGIDVAGNADYCETYIIVTDNLGNCTNDMATVSGLLKTEMGDGLEESDIEFVRPTSCRPIIRLLRYDRSVRFI